MAQDEFDSQNQDTAGCSSHNDVNCLCDVVIEDPVIPCSDEVWLKNNPAATIANQYWDGDIARWATVYLDCADQLAGIRKSIDLDQLVREFHELLPDTGCSIVTQRGSIIRKILLSGVELKHLPEVLGTSPEEVAYSLCRMWVDMSFDELLELQQMIRDRVPRNEIKARFGISVWVIKEMTRLMLLPELLNPHKKLTPEDVDQIRTLVKEGHKRSDVASIYDIDKSRVTQLMKSA